jgi:hypothetical protein
MKQLALLSLCFLWMNFSPSNQEQIFPTKLEVIVRNDLGNIVEGASVQLFKTEEDYDKGENPVTQIQKTDAKGKVIFTDLETVAYYVQAEKDDMSNQGAGAKTVPLVAKKTNKITIIISE